MVFENVIFLVRSGVGYLVFKNAEKLRSGGAVCAVWCGVVQKKIVFENAIFLRMEKWAKKEG